MRRRHGAEPHQRQREREAGEIDEFAQQLGRAVAGVDDAAARIDDRPLGAGQRERRLADGIGVALGARLVGAMGHLLRRHVGAGALGDVLRQVDEHGSGPTAARHQESLVDGARQIVRLFHQIVVLRARSGDAGRVTLLEGIVADQVRRHLTADADQRHAVHQRVGQAGHRIGGARPGGHEHHAHPAGGAGKTLGGMHRAAFLAHQHMADRVLFEQFVIDREDGPTWIAEYVRNALIHERFQNDLCSGHLVVGHGVHLSLTAGLGRAVKGSAM